MVGDLASGEIRSLGRSTFRSLVRYESDRSSKTSPSRRDQFS